MQTGIILLFSTSFLNLGTIGFLKKIFCVFFLVCFLGFSVHPYYHFLSSSLAPLFIYLFYFLILFNFFFFLIFYLFLAMLGLCCCAGASSSCGKWGLLFVAVRGLLIAVSSLVAERGL